jgi:hypothetical protein
MVESAAKEPSMYVQPSAPAPPNPLLVLVVAVVIVAYVGYRIYSAILNQMAKNAKNKRIIKNEVTQWTGREYRRSNRR